MAVQYAPFPEFQVPNVNILGALAQGQASQLQEVQAAKAAQAMELAGQKDIREAAKYDMESKVKLQELNEKIRALAMSRLSAVPVGDQESYLKTIGEFKDIFPSEYDVLSKRKWDADTRRMVLLTPEQQYKQETKDIVGPTGETQTYGYSPYLGGAAPKPLGGLVSAPEWVPQTNKEGYIIGYKSKQGTQQITPEEFQRRSQRPNRAEVEDYIRNRATAIGVDPEIAVRVARSEGLNQYVGDQGSSFGPYQLHYGGIAPGGNRVGGLGDEFTKQTGLDARDPSTWRQQVDFSLAQAKQGGWGPWHGAAKVGIGERQGINAMAPRQVAAAGPMNGMLAPAPAPAPAPMTLPGATNIPQPIQSYTPAPIGTEREQEQKSALDLLNAFEYNPEAGTSRPAELLESASGGRVQQVWEKLTGALGISTPAGQAGARLEASQKNAVLRMIKGKMGQGFTDQDRDFVMSAVGGLDDTAVPIGTRLSKFDEAIRMLTRQAGVPYKPAPQLERLKSVGGRGKAGESTYEQPKAKPLGGRIKFMELGD